MEWGICPSAPLAFMSSVTWPLEPQMVLFYWWSVDAKSLSCMVAEILSLKHLGVMTLTFSGHVTSSVTWPLEPKLVVYYWSSIDTMSLYRTVAEILSVKNNWVTSLTPRCHVTSLVTWPLEPHMVLSYWWSVDTKSLSRMVDDILCVIIWITIFPLYTHWKPIFFWGGEGEIQDYAIFQ